ncbi:MAG: 8-amino-7-oxononanoate synthase [Candidatus Omnitrophota bacterium]
MEEIKKILDFIDRVGLYPDIKAISGSATPEVVINGRKTLLFSSNSYLGIASSDKLKQAGIDAINKYGIGTAGARLLSGNLEIHVQVEKEIAKFKHCDDAIVFNTGYMTNVGAISAVMNLPKIGPSSFFKGTGIIFSDELNHASIIDGCKLSNASVIIYKHVDMKDLEGKLRWQRKRRKLIITDGVFSMDGDIAPLDKIAELAKKYKAMVMVDDAHATGVLGKNGSGTPEHFNLTQDDIDIMMGTLSKALAGAGGYVAGKKDLIRYLRVTSRPYIFSTSMPASNSAAVIAAIREIKDHPELIRRLWENANQLREGFKERGFNTLKSQSQIIPVLIGEEKKAIEAARILFERGFFAPCVRWPAVAKGQARIRFTVMASHSEHQINLLLDEFSKISKELGIIN